MILPKICMHGFVHVPVSFLYLLVLGIGCAILLCHLLGLPYNYLESALYVHVHVWADLIRVLAHGKTLQLLHLGSLLVMQNFIEEEI